MRHDLITAEENVVAELKDLAERAREYAERAKSENTRRAYRADMAAFKAWCRSRGLRSLPAEPETVAAYLIALAPSLKVSTLMRRLSAIREAHQQIGLDLDTGSAAFRDIWRGIRNKHGAPAHQKAPLLTAGLRKAIAASPETVIGQRDRALLLIGFAAALRRSELVGLEVKPRDGALGYIEATDEGLVIHLTRSKADQRGEGAVIGVPYGSDPQTCPVRAYATWLAASGIDEGPAFRAINRHGQIATKPLTGRSVARIVKRAVTTAAMAAGLSQEEAEAQAAQFAGHSLRAGLATSAAANDAPGHAIQRQLRHARFDTTVKYIRAGNLFKGNAAGMAGL